MKKPACAISLLVILVIQSMFLSSSALARTETSNGKVEESNLSDSISSSASMSAPSSSAVLVAYMGTLGTSWAMLFYDNYNAPGKGFYLKYYLTTSGLWNISEIVAYIYGYSAIFYLQYDNGTMLKDTLGRDVLYTQVQSGATASGYKWFYLANEPDWSKLKWFFQGDAFGRSWNSVKTEQNKHREVEWVKLTWNSFKVAKFIIAIVGVAALAATVAGTVASGGALAPLAVIIAEEILLWLAEEIVDEVADTVVEQKIEDTTQAIRNLYSDSDWRTATLLAGGYVDIYPEVHLEFSGETFGQDTWGGQTIADWEDTNGPIDLIGFNLKITVARFNKVSLDFLSVNTSIVHGAWSEGDIDPGHWSTGASYVREFTNVGYDILEILRLMKHDDWGKPYFEYTMHVIVDPEITWQEGDLRNWFKQHPTEVRYSETQIFSGTVTTYTVKNQTSPLSTKKTMSDKIEFLLNPIQPDDYTVGIVLGIVAYIIYKNIQTILAVISYPPYQMPKYYQIAPLPTWRLDQIGQITAPPPTLALKIPNGNQRFIIAMPQTPIGQEYKAVLAFDTPSPYEYQLVYVPTEVAQLNIRLDLPALNKQIMLSPTTVDEIMAVSTKNPNNMAFVVPKMPLPGEAQTVFLSNPDNVLLLTAQTTTTYPLRISLPDIPRTTYMKIPSSGNLNLHILSPSTPNPVIPILTNEVGVFLDPGGTTSNFNFYSNIGVNRTSRVAHGSLSVPPSAEYTVDVLGSGLAFSENDTTPKVSATKDNSISISLQLIGHGVDLDYTKDVGTGSYKIKVVNIGVVQDTFDLNVIQKPSGWTVTLSSNSVTLASGDSTEVDMTITEPPGQKYPNLLIKPYGTGFMNENSFSPTYTVTVKATSRGDNTAWDVVKVPVGTASLFDAALNKGNTNVNGTLTFRDTFFVLKGNITVESGGDLTIYNSTVIVDEVSGKKPILTVLNGGKLNITDSEIDSSEQGSSFNFDIRGTFVLKGEAKIKDASINLLNNLEIGGGAHLFLSNSLVEAGNSSFTPTITVHTNSSIGLLNSRIQAFNPLSPFQLRGGGKIINYQSQLANYREYGFTVETSVYSLHVHQGETAQYTIQIRNVGNNTDTITLSLEMSPDPQWNAQLSQSVFPLTAGQTALTTLSVWSSSPMPANKFIRVKITGQSSGDPEKLVSLNTYTTFLTTIYPLGHLSYNNTDIFLSKKEPVEEETVNIGVIVHNDGDQPAANVQTTFYDNTAQALIGVVNIPQIGPRSWATASVSWFIPKASIHEVSVETNYPYGSILDTTTFTIKDKPDSSLTATISFDPPLSAYTGELIYFDAFNSTDSDSNITEYLWDFGDGSTGFGPMLAYSYRENGTYTVTLRAIDDDGLARASTLQITILNRPPVADFSFTPTTPVENEAVLFNASASFDLDGTISQYTWDFGDGSSSTLKEATHKYQQNGTYTVTLTVADNDGSLNSKNATIIIVIPPTIDDLALHSVAPNKNIVGQGYNLVVNVNITNHGNVNENSNVTVYADQNTTIFGDEIIIGKQNVTLSKGGSSILSFTWNTAGVTKGNYVLSASATPVLGEINTADNSFIGGSVMIATPGDVNGDAAVNIADYAALSAHWYPGPPVGPLGYDPTFDIDIDGTINIVDVSIVSAYWTGPPKGPLAP